MSILGIDASLGAFSTAVLQDGEARALRELPGNVALEQGLAAIREVLREARIRGAQLERLAVGIGPGSFTGVRIAVSYAKSLALGWKRPLAGVNSFDALECGLAVQGAVLAVVRGRPGVVSVRLRAENGEFRASGYVRDVLDRLPGPRTELHVVGSAEDVLSGLAERGWSVHYLDRAVTPSALAVASIAAAREPAASPHELRADYGESPAAKVPKR